MEHTNKIAAIVSLCLGGVIAMNIAVAEEPTSKAPEAGEQEETTEKKSEAPVEIPTVKPELAAEGGKAWVEVAKVLQSPRCMNCHPAGDRPLQTDESRPHQLNISRTSEAAGLKCSTCHQEQNSEALGIKGGPPGAPNWHLPPKDMPMVFEGLTAAELCVQMKDPAQNGGKNLAQLLHHVSEDPLVLWGWNPGGDRTKPPLAHDAFVAQFETWVKSGGACPE